tara:strand:+ start:35 stop:391 length:357 start_codon:yes stop_codon:yes gene_type:complete
MNIIKNETFVATNFGEVEIFSQKYIKQKINIFYSFKAILWQGPFFVKEIEKKLKTSNLTFIAEADINLGLALSIIELNFKYLAISKSMDIKIIQKIKSMAKKKNVKVLFSEDLNFSNK